jgi:hypothetical protein
MPFRIQKVEEQIIHENTRVSQGILQVTARGQRDDERISNLQNGGRRCKLEFRIRQGGSRMARSITAITRKEVNERATAYYARFWQGGYACLHYLARTGDSRTACEK